MVGPICIYNFNFRFGGVAAFLNEVITDKNQILLRHCKPHFGVICPNFRVRIVYKPFQLLYIVGNDRFVNERLRLIKRNLFAFDGIYKMIF